MMHEDLTRDYTWKVANTLVLMGEPDAIIVEATEKAAQAQQSHGNAENLLGPAEEYAETFRSTGPRLRPGALLVVFWIGIAWHIFMVAFWFLRGPLPGMTLLGYLGLPSAVLLLIGAYLDGSADERRTDRLVTESRRRAADLGQGQPATPLTGT